MQDAIKKKLQLDEKAERERVQPEKELQFELRLHEAKAKLPSEIIPEVSTGIRAGSEPKTQGKLPKLHITKFNGTYTQIGLDFGTFF